MPSEPLDATWCADQLHSQLVARRLLYYPRISSTNDEALRLADSGEPEGLVVLADSQTAGRGRQGRRWQDEPGHCLLFSVLLRPAAEPRLLPILSLGAAAAVAEALSSRYNIPVATRWPNDLVIGGRKVGGLLLERRGEAVVVGLGLNVNGRPNSLQAHVDRPLTTLEAEYGAPLQREEVLVGIIEKMDDIYRQFQAGDSVGLIRRYRKFESLLGQAVCATLSSQQIRGIAEAISDLGALVVATPQGRREITAGEVELLVKSE